ncbi:MAG TPA: glutamine synthetase family protein [Gemmatimonadaceae bacterium]
MLTLEQLREQIAANEIDTVVVGFTDHYGRLMGKRYDAEMFVDSVVVDGAHGCDYLLTTDMEMEPVRGYRFASWELGYGDFHLVADMATLRVATWLPHSALVLCDVRHTTTHEPIAVAPRSILKNQTEAAERLGFATFAASELEHYLFRASYAEVSRAALRDLSPAGWYLEDYHLMQGARTEDFHGAVRRHLKDSGVPVESSKGEWGRGQHEVNVRYADTLTMADRHVVFKQCMKELAESMGVSVTFMAKVGSNQAGSGCHIHFSLWRDGRNAFVGDKSLGPITCSDEFRWFLGGWIARVPEVMVFYAPTVNSYKRYVDASWAPTRLAWSRDNRTAGFRVVGDGDALRIECRIAGADCNPYLAFAASLASGLDGIVNRTEPPAAFSGDIYAAQHLPRVPYTLAEATESFGKSEFAKRAFGDDVVEHYLHFFRSEQRAYDMAVTDWEIQRYFERI